MNAKKPKLFTIRKKKVEKLGKRKLKSKFTLAIQRANGFSRLIQNKGVQGRHL
jgi:hypothetical protein